ncbi:hypothetical protein QTP86_011609 [Hemibagrus guttatus]|nr:hypothetical protein QTP86_011609 [Hemibagrus guttatus]
MMERRKVDILCVQETRWKGSKARSIGAGFKLFYYGVYNKRNGVGVVLKEEFVRNVLEVKRVSDRVMSLKLEIEGVMLNVVSGYAPQVGCELEEKERFWSELDEVMESIPTGERVVIGEDFNGYVGEGNRGDEEVMGKFGVKERNLEGQMVVDFAKRMDMAVVNTYFQKREEHRVTYKSGSRRTQKLRQALGGQVVLLDDWKSTAEVIRETGRKVLGVSSGRRKEDKETWWWNEEVQDSIQRKRLAKKKWDMDRTEENRQEYKELQRRVKREVSKAKQKAYDKLYTRLDTREGQKDLYRLARQRDRDGKYVQQVRVIKDRDGRVLTSEESVQRRWKEYFEELMNEENEREKRGEGVNSVEQEVDKIRKDEFRKALKRMKSGKAVGPDDIPVEVWKCLGEAAVEFLTSLFNRVLESEKMPEEWRRSGLVLIFKNKGDVQSCSNYRGIKLMSHTIKLWERVVEARLRKVVEICEQQYGFMPRKSTTDAIFALRILMEKYRDGQRELHCEFIDLEKAYDRVPREELWYCMRKSGVAEKYVRVVQDMYERSRTVVRCAVGQTEEFKVEMGLHQGSALSPFLFAMVMDQLSEEVRQESPWTMMFADDIVTCNESREQVEENLERWRFALERRGIKFGEWIQTQNTSPIMDPAELRDTIVRQGDIILSYQNQVEALEKQLRSATLAAPRDPHAAHGESPHLALPEKFDGSADRCRGFLRQCEVFFAHQPGMYREEETQCAFVLSLLTSRTLEWASALWDADHQVRSSFSYFVELIREVFEYPAGGKDMSTQLMELCQGSDTTADYAIKFRTLAAQSGWNDASLWAVFWAGLNPELQTELA